MASLDLNIRARLPRSFDPNAFRKVARRRFENIAILTNRDAERKRPERRSEDRSHLALTS